jgi:hypothetical protein
MAAANLWINMTHLELSLVMDVCSCGGVNIVNRMVGWGVGGRCLEGEGFSPVIFQENFSFFSGNFENEKFKIFKKNMERMIFGSDPRTLQEVYKLLYVNVFYIVVGCDLWCTYRFAASSGLEI